MTSRDDNATGPTEDAAKKSSTAQLFDIRRIIGGLFVLYGVVLLVTGIVDGSSASEQAAGIDINVWAGIGMALTGAFFLVWMWLSPLATPAPKPGDQSSERP
jgi:hypothetical protein